VNDAFYGLVKDLHNGLLPTRKTPSRYGDVIQITEPVLVTYRNPCERVLFNEARDCNPFFHLYEALWMLAGRRDVTPLAWYNSKMTEFSDDQEVFHGAYGYRWRKWFGYDQLDAIVEELKKTPTSRRVVLQMWDATVEPPHPGLLTNGSNWSDPYKAVNGGKDVPCNTQAYFAIREALTIEPDGFSEQGTAVYTKFLDMTVCNRSNDMIWGMLGANVVHFSVLQEYLAARIGVSVGRYYQFTNNLHVYTERWTPAKWLEATYNREYRDNVYPYPMVLDPDRFDVECNMFVHLGYGNGLNDLLPTVWSNPFFPNVALPMALAFRAHKERSYQEALKWVESIHASDWRMACRQWITRRQAKWEVKNA
jgi:thymidylate synthase